MTESNRNELLDYLQGLNDSMFLEVVKISGVDRKHLTTSGLTPFQRACDLLELADLRAETRNALYEWIEANRKPVKPAPAEPSSAGSETEREQLQSAKGVESAETSDPLLSERVEALRQYLMPMTDMETYVEKLFLNIPTSFADDDDDIWASLVKEIRKKANKLIKTLSEIDKSLSSIGSQTKMASAVSTRDLWHLYRETHKKSQQVFQESIELIGGLILRGNLKETKVWEVADELIRFWARWVLDRKGLFRIPAPKEAFGQTLRRIIHLRFPEWTIWNLPQTAHEFGRVLVSESSDLKEKIKEAAGGREGAYPGEVRERVFDSDQSMDWQVSRLQVLAADAFATYVMGPAYACTAIMVRLDPSITQDLAEAPADYKRVYTILEMLRRMDRASGRRSTYRDVIEQLDKTWNLGLEKASPETRMDHAEKERLDDFIESVWQLFDENFLPKVRYSGEMRDAGERGRCRNGWQCAEEWGRLWDESIEAGVRELELPDVDATSKLRDALNAAWLCRLYWPEYVDLIAKAAAELCNLILQEQKKASKRPQTAGKPSSVREQQRTRGIR